MKKSLLLIPASFLLASCSQRHVYTESGGVAVGYPVATLPAPPGTKPIPFQPEGLLIKATAFQMNGDYADNVAITLDNNGNIIYFPGPGDISSSSKPIELAEGWWLNRQGIGENSVFTTYTFEEYSQLPAPPSPARLKEAIIPGARVTGFVQLPFPSSEAAGHLNEINEYIVNNLSSENN